MKREITKAKTTKGKIYFIVIAPTLQVSQSTQSKKNITNIYIVFSLIKS